VCKQYGNPKCANSLNAPCPYIKYWHEMFRLIRNM